MIRSVLALLAASAAALHASPAMAQGAAQEAAPPATLPGDTILDPAPGAEAIALGRVLAETGTLAALLPLMEAQETAQMLADLPDLTAAEQERLRAIAAATAAAGRERLMDATARQYAMRLTPDELRTLAEAARTPAARKLQAALPYTIAGTMQSVGELDFKGETLAAFCAETGKGCGG